MEQPNSPQRPDQRTRVPLRVSQVFSACSFCKYRKIKCDGVAPACGGCVRFGRQSTCSMATGGSSHGRDYPSYLQSKIQGLREALASRDDALPPSTSLPDHVGRTALDGDAAGGEAGEGFRNQFSVIDTLIADIGGLPILASSSPTSLDGPTLSTLVLAAAGTRPSSLITYMPYQQPKPVDIRASLPEYSIALKLARHYISEVYPRLPFFSIQGFWAQFNHVFAETSVPSEALDLNPPRDPTATLSPSAQDLSDSALNQGYSYFTVLVVLAISTSSLSRSADSIISSQAQRLFNAALMFRDSAVLPNTVIGVQSLLFLVQFATLNPSLLDAWYLIGVGIRNCIDLGLHQDPHQLDSVSPSLLETRRRLWWSMYSFDRSMSLGCGRPTEISDDVISVCLPSFQIESNATEVEVDGYLQRYKALQIQSEIYDRLNRAPGQEDTITHDIAELSNRLSEWRSRNSPLHSQTLVESEWFMGRMLLHRPCRLIPKRNESDLWQLWESARGFASLYRQLVESNSIFYVQIACEKTYWTGLAILHSYWQLRCHHNRTTSDIRPLDLWMVVKDVSFILQTLSERWEAGKFLTGNFESVSATAIELMESKSTTDTIMAGMPKEVAQFRSYTSLTSIWSAGKAQSDHGRGIVSTGDELQELITGMI